MMTNDREESVSQADGKDIELQVLSRAGKTKMEKQLDDIHSRLGSLRLALGFLVVAGAVSVAWFTVDIATTSREEEGRLLDEDIKISQLIGESNSKLFNMINGGGDANALPGMQGRTWNQIQALARAQPLNFYLWSPLNQDGTPTSPRRWIDSWLTPQLNDFGISVNRMDAQYDSAANQADCGTSVSMRLICDIQNEVDSGKTESGGAVDLVWINGDNFAEGQRRGLFYGPWAPLIPNAANFDWSSPAITYDKGVLTGGLEFPFNLAQSIFIHDEIKVPNPPKTVPAFKDWVQANPGKFTYSDTDDFTGSAFVRTMFYHYGGDAVPGGSYKDLLGPFDEALYQERSPAVWAALNEMEPFLWKNGTANAVYPRKHSEIRAAIGRGDLWMDFSFQQTEASTQILSGNWAQSLQGYIFDSGSISDTNFLAIPVNAQNKEAALVAVNHIASATSMFNRAMPEVWGALQAFDPAADTMKPWDVAFDYIDSHEATPTIEAMTAGRLPDVSSEWKARIDADWKLFVRDA